MQEVTEESLSNLDASVIQSIFIVQMQFPLSLVNAQACAERYRDDRKREKEGVGEGEREREKEKVRESERD